MKRFLSIIIAAVLIAVAMTTITSCSQWDTPYGDLDEAGKTVSVKFLANGGLFANTTGVTVVDAYDEEKATTGSGIKVIAPNDSSRGNRVFNISKNGHVFAGWYVAELDEDGNPVIDGDGNISFDKTEKWDFENDRLKLEAGGDYTSERPSLTLCAAWIPYTDFEIYVPNGEGGFTLHETVEVQKLNLPVWTDKGSIDMKNFPAISNMTFTGAYYDEACTEQITSSPESIFDLDNVACLNPKVKIYTTWREGTWYKIETASQLALNASRRGCYEILNDLDFEGAVWPKFQSFEGKIIGGGHKISNVTVVQSDTKPSNVGLFGAINSGAVLQDVTFENVSYTVKGSMNNEGTNYGLLAGTVESGAVFTDVTVSGVLVIDESMFDEYLSTFNGKHSVKLLVGSGTAAGVEYGITAELDPDVTNGAITTLPDGTVRIDVGGQNG